MKRKRKRICVWTGGQPGYTKAVQARANALPALPSPTPLRRAAQITYEWGPQRFTIFAAACSLRTTRWGNERVTWLHCKAREAVEVRPDQPVGLMTALIPAAYVTSLGPGGRSG
jgi:hypothetical protein